MENERLIFISGFFLVLQFLIYATSRTPLVLLAASFLQFLLFQLLLSVVE
ncbi:hypothetical protein SNF32_15785 [Enterococcus mundtii]|nr:hypothetical protein [Enterococcus mundtii]